VLPEDFKGQELEGRELEGQELALVYVAKTLKEALRLEEVLTGAGFNYMVEPDTYRGGVVFVSERVGAFFYVAPADDPATRAAMKRAGFEPYQA
jgi:hypothetical protein